MCSRLLPGGMSPTPNSASQQRKIHLPSLRRGRAAYQLFEIQSWFCAQMLTSMYDVKFGTSTIVSTIR
jgi:hypothetical protein